MLTCCSLPRVSVKRRSAHLTSLSLIIFTTSLELIPPPLVECSSGMHPGCLLLRWPELYCTGHANPCLAKSVTDSAACEISELLPGNKDTSIVRGATKPHIAVQLRVGQGFRGCPRGLPRSPARIYSRLP